ncbi:hypothetical protein NC651_038760 [Populus alba x Populus x berolinensis]|nr:hypothetical protein NC651_038760 [Populus alba x Populus x berolinensis]
MKSTSKPDRHRFILSSLFFIFFLCALATINGIRFDGLLSFGRCALSNIPSQSSTPSSNNFLAVNSSTSSDDIRILIGILTLPDQYQRRHFLRLIYGTQSPVGAQIDVKFVFCNLTKEDQKVLVALEIMRYDDIIILDCKENMNKGKTYTYFSSLPEMLNDTDRPYPPYHYVMKTDDDTYFRLDNLVESLKPLPREDLYYGYVIPCPSMDPFVHYMSGMGYMISWDIVEWIRDSEVPKNHLEGPEDKVFGDWIREGHRAKNRYNAKWSMYNFPEPHTQCTHELWPNTTAVHLLKNQEKWIQTLKYFNQYKYITCLLIPPPPPPNLSVIVGVFHFISFSYLLCKHLSVSCINEGLANHFSQLKMGSKPAPFSDIGKRAKDLLTKDYNYDHKFTLSILSSTGMGFTATGLKKDEIFNGDISTLYRSKNTVVDVKVDTYSIVSTKVTVNDIFPSTKAALSFKIPDHKSGKLDVQYLHHHAAIDSSIGLNPNPLLELSAAIGSNNLSMGGEVGFDTASSSFVKCNAGIGLNKPDFSAAFLLTDKGQTLKASYVHLVNPLHSVAAEMTHRLSSLENCFTIGSSHAVDPFTVVKTRFSDNGKAAMLCQHEWRPKSLITFSAEYDPKATHAAAPKFGLALALKP